MAKHISNEIKNIIISNYPTKGLIWCAETTGLTQKTVRGIKSRLKLKLTKEHKKEIVEQRRIADALAADINIKTPEQAYLFGFLWGDGHLKCSNGSFYPYLGIVEKDFSIISYIFEGWNITNRSRSKNRQRICEAIKFDREMGLFLLKNDYLQKSYVSPTKILHHISVDLLNYFWRGFSDADGCFYINEKNHIYQYILSGSYKQDWTDVENICKQLNIVYTVTQITNNGKHKQYHSSRVRIVGKNNVKKMGDFLYAGKMFGLQRKYEKYKTIKDKCE